MLKVFSIPILKDNYVHLITDLTHKTCIVIDPGVAGPVIEFITAQKLNPMAILLTHHHGDHTNGTEELRDHFREQGGPVVYAPAREKADIPFADKYLLPEDRLKIANFEFQVLSLPGHTLGHIAFYEPHQGWLFSGDVIFSLGCGRIFEGTMEQQFKSLQVIKALPPGTEIYCTHEYTWMNTQFCLEYGVETLGISKITLQNFAKKVQETRQQGKPTVPFSLQQELDLNPFLKAASLAEFQAIREARNHY